MDRSGGHHIAGRDEGYPSALICRLRLLSADRAFSTAVCLRKAMLDRARRRPLYVFVYSVYVFSCAATSAMRRRSQTISLALWARLCQSW